MGIQKRRHSRARVTRSRRQWRIPAISLVACPQCHQLTLPHRVCPACGYYAGRSVLQREAEKK
ncbi:MAG: 50S ribosomal protein L32 [Armatimonadota bacterium]|nr:50S ribosomal protein L32 [Armatimonadota bacterium]MDR7427093.1 50S ribosomal protein L32 [Armatimonadota bacterium]MDR7465599.1 50S ribosomal protein L32 [Armatimonadota bacterium]MDR7470037.1 50S ribosomal protein L32 [Armatimonadota bacterium]MDR7474139.1 50S ribosomal protein L32 [Armatimonadota bacterium]